jgi:hypothetical protein
LGIRSGGHPDRVPTTEEGDKFALECFHLRTKDITPMTKDPQSRLTDSIIDLRSKTAQVK